MLQADDPHVDMMAERDRLLQELAPDLDRLREQFGMQSIREIRDAETQVLRYPVDRYPTRVVAMNFDKTPTIEAVLLGIKGQYLVFDDGVINLRRYTSYEIEFEDKGHVTDVGESLSLF